MTGTRRISDRFGWPDGDGFLVEIEAQAVVEP